MNKITVNGKNEYQLEPKEVGLNWDMVKIREGQFHIIKNHKSYVAEIVECDAEAKKMTIAVNGQSFELEIQSRMDILLEEMGMSGLNEQKAQDVKAPMPGLVLEINVAIGQAIEKGDAVLVLEAMKMENVLKSPAAGVVASIEIEKGNAVEKGQILVTFE